MTMTETRTEASRPGELIGPFAGRSVELSTGFQVARVLPYRTCRSVGPFVFLDHFGPADLTKSAPMDVGPHPHIGLCTLTYLYHGAIVHRDSTGAEHAIVPGGVNYMVSGKGAVHTERGGDGLKLFPNMTTCHGLQLWTALPKELQDMEPSFHHADAVVDIPAEAASAKLVIGRAFGVAQTEIPVHSDLFLVDLSFTSKGDEFVFGDNSFDTKDKMGLEVGIYVSDGAVKISHLGPEPITLAKDQMVVVRYDPGESPPADATIEAISDGIIRVAILGGAPLFEK